MAVEPRGLIVLMQADKQGRMDETGPGDESTPQVGSSSRRQAVKLVMAFGAEQADWPERVAAIGQRAQVVSFDVVSAAAPRAAPAARLQRPLAGRSLIAAGDWGARPVRLAVLSAAATQREPPADEARLQAHNLVAATFAIGSVTSVRIAFTSFPCASRISSRYAS